MPPAPVGEYSKSSLKKDTGGVAGHTKEGFSMGITSVETVYLLAEVSPSSIFSPSVRLFSFA